VLRIWTGVMLSCRY